jgi:hypothetical protein
VTVDQQGSGHSRPIESAAGWPSTLQPAADGHPQPVPIHRSRRDRHTSSSGRSTWDPPGHSIARAASMSPWAPCGSTATTVPAPVTRSAAPARWYPGRRPAAGRRASDDSPAPTDTPTRRTRRLTRRLRLRLVSTTRPTRGRRPRSAASITTAPPLVGPATATFLQLPSVTTLPMASGERRGAVRHRDQCDTCGATHGRSGVRPPSKRPATRSPGSAGADGGYRGRRRHPRPSAAVLQVPDQGSALGQVHGKGRSSSSSIRRVAVRAAVTSSGSSSPPPVAAWCRSAAQNRPRRRPVVAQFDASPGTCGVSRMAPPDRRQRPLRHQQSQDGGLRGPHL